MKKILLLFAAAICAVASWAQATVSATITGEELTVALNDNGQHFVAFQMDIQLPSEISVDASGAITLMTDRLTQPGTASEIDASETVDFKVAYNVLAGNVLRVVAYNLENREIVGEEGKPLFSVALHGTSETDITLSNVLFVDKALIEQTLANAVAQPGGVLGDVDGSGFVTMADVALALNMYLGLETSLPAADIDNSGSITMADVAAILNIYLGI